MSPFKGQGANQALLDGPALVEWLERASLDSAVTGFMREATQRTAPVVMASRQAAMEWHSTRSIQQQTQSFAGVRLECLPEWLSLLKDRSIGAHLSHRLDSTIGRLLQGKVFDAIRSPEPDRTVDANHQQTALQYAKVGDTQGLRILSLAKHSESIRTAQDTDGKTCLHWAAVGGHIATCQWLISELDCDRECRDSYGKSSQDYADESGVSSTISLFATVGKRPMTSFNFESSAS